MSITTPSCAADVVDAVRAAWTGETTRTFHPDGTVSLTHTTTGHTLTVRDDVEPGQVTLDGRPAMKAEAARAVALETMRHLAGEESDNGCLTGLRCPTCGNRERLRILIEAGAVMGPDGLEDIEGDLTWDEGASITCLHCEHRGFLREFTRGQAPMTDVELRLEFQTAQTAADLLRAATLLQAERGANADLAAVRASLGLPASRHATARDLHAAQPASLYVDTASLAPTAD